MKINLKVLQKLHPTYGVSPLQMQPGAIKAIQSGNSVKAPAKYEPILIGAGYIWSDDDNAYHLDDQSIYYFDPGQTMVWTWQGMFRPLKGTEMLTKWIQGNEKYPEGKANSFMATYKGMTGDEDGGGGTAVAEPEEDDDDGDDRLKGGGDIEISPTPGKRVDDFEPKPVDPTDADIAKIKKIAGKSMYLPSDVMIDYGLKAKKNGNEKLLKFLSQFKPLKENMAKKSQLETLVREIARVVSAEAKKKKKPSGENPSGISKAGKDDDDEPRTDLPPQRTKADIGRYDWSKGYEPPARDPDESWVEDIANKIWPDPMDIGRGGIKWRIEKTADAKSGERVFMLKKTQTITRTRFIIKRGDKWFYLDEKPDHTKKWTEIPGSPPVTEDGGGAGGSAGGAVASGGGPVGMSTTTNVSPYSTPKAFKKKKEEQIDEMTTTDSGTPGYMIPGAFSREGGSKKGVEGSKALGYELTKIGREDMKMKADKLYEDVVKDIKKMLGK